MSSAYRNHILAASISDGFGSVSSKAGRSTHMAYREKSNAGTEADSEVIRAMKAFMLAHCSGEKSFLSPEPGAVEN